MITRIFGILDLLIVFIILASPVITSAVLFVAAAYLLCKGLFFVFLSPNLASFADIGIGVYIVVLGLGLNFGLLTVISVVFLAQKGLLSLA